MSGVTFFRLKLRSCSMLLHSNVSLQYTPKQHSNQYTGLKYVIYIEMTDLKFTLTGQCHKTTILHSKKEKSYLAWYHPTTSQGRL